MTAAHLQRQVVRPQHIYKHLQIADLAGLAWGAHLVAEMRSGSEVGSFLRLVDSLITQFKAQGPSRTCNESNEEEEKTPRRGGLVCKAHRLLYHSTLGLRVIKKKKKGAPRRRS